MGERDGGRLGKEFWSRMALMSVCRLNPFGVGVSSSV